MERTAFLRLLAANREALRLITNLKVEYFLCILCLMWLSLGGDGGGSIFGPHKAQNAQKGIMAPGPFVAPIGALESFE